MHEVWEKQQTHEDARKMRRTNMFVNFFLEIVRASSLEVMIW